MDVTTRTFVPGFHWWNSCRRGHVRKGRIPGDE